jgi:thermitase
MRKSLSVLVGCLMMSPFALAKTTEAKRVAGEYIIKVKGDKTSYEQSLKSVGLKLKQDLNLLSGRFLVATGNGNEKSILNSINKISGVIYSEPNFIYEIVTPQSSIDNDDEKFSLMWGLLNQGMNQPTDQGIQSGEAGTAGSDINAVQAWTITKGSSAVKIAVIDTGFDYNHPDLAGNIWTNPGEVAGNGVDDDNNGYVDDVHGYNFSATVPHGNPMDGNGHGTHCSGTIGAKHNNIGVAGVMDNVQIMGVKFLSDQGSGSTAAAIQAINYATVMNVDIMSNSWGGGGFSQALQDAITAAKNQGILFVAAAGNSASNNDTRATYPANYPVDNIISVASHTHRDMLSNFSCYGRNTVHVAAPGSKIFSTLPNGAYGVYSGTSMATPHVAGALGLLVAQSGRLPVLSVRERVMATSVPAQAYRRVKGGGRLDAYNLLTDTRPARQDPPASAWVRENLATTYESLHPYVNNGAANFTITVPGATHIRLVIERYDLESGYDFLTVTSGGVEIDKVSGNGMNYVTDYAVGDTLQVSFRSDVSETAWGYEIKQVEVIR